MLSIDFEDDVTSRMHCWSVGATAADGGAIEGGYEAQSESHMSCCSKDM